MFWSIATSVFDSSNLTFTTFILVLTVCILVQRFFFTSSDRNLPPCPRFQLPIIGHLYLLEPDITKPFARFRRELGDVFRLQFGNRMCIVISGYDLIKDALLKHGEAFSHRPHLPVAEEITRGAGMLMANGEKWKEHRRFTLSTLKDFGMGKSILEKRIHEQIEILFESYDANNGEPFNPKNPTQIAVGNVICSMIFGTTFKHGDKKFRQIADGFEENLSSGIIAGILNFVPSLRWLPGDLFNLKKMLKNSDNVFKFVEEIIEEHQKTYDENNIDDYVSAYICRLNHLQRTGEATTFNQQYKKETMVLPIWSQGPELNRKVHELGATFADLFGAGTETTATSLLWSFPLLASYPEIQNRMFEEIKMHVGTDRLPSVQDKSNLTYVEAFYMEVLRFTNLTSAGVPRAMTHDLDFHGFRLPAGAMVFVDMSSVFLDPKIWTDPETFRPERFLDETGKLKKSDELIAFSLGKRSCVGESLARMELFLFLSSIVQRYELLCPTGRDLSMATVDGEFRTVHAPKPYEIIFKLRTP